MVVESRPRDFPVECTRETFSTPDNPDVDSRRQDAAAQSSREVSAVQPTVSSGKVYFMKNPWNT